MKRWLRPLRALFGASEQGDEVVVMDPGTILYSLPTIAMDELEFVVPTRESFEGAPQFHEDIWRQLEFYPGSRREEIQQLLVECQRFERTHRQGPGWNQIYARRIAPAAMLNGADALQVLASVFETRPGRAPILTAARQPLGQVKGGFSVAIAPKIWLYGLRDEDGLGVLAVLLDSGADDFTLTRAFIALHQQHGLILVDWRQQMLLAGVQPDGDIEVWSP
ncbi:hypothetical protein [Lysobacter sp. cf310]|uniref:hypothetical protein n=1 Tax=Lysobacter sp. cf310 TaxID=1761790 RepID=UPI0008E580FB|nr:hypothetical protein [Lysobacter sp. cf310]SFL33031.1 hypothetical protein SAMN04487938_4197 [Lysobacter sp. cf310]